MRIEFRPEPANYGGFTLIELMIVVAIVAILAAIAYPAYQDQVRKTRRADCEGTMMELAGALERYFTENNSYVGFTLGSDPSTSPDFINQCPPDPARNAVYTLSLSSVTANSFQINATPTGPQTGDECGTLTLNQALQKGASGGTVAECW